MLSALLHSSSGKEKNQHNAKHYGYNLFHSEYLQIPFFRSLRLPDKREVNLLLLIICKFQHLINGAVQLLADLLNRLH